VRVLVVGDSFLPVAAFRDGLERIAADHELAYLQLDESAQFTPSSASELRIREHAGSPAQVIEGMGEAEALVVHAAPVTDEVLAAAPGLRLVCCARGGPVNVDLEAASRRRVPVTTTPGKNAEAVAELTLAFMIMLARGLPSAQRFAAAGALGASAIEGAQFFGRELAGRPLGLVGYGRVGSRVARYAAALSMGVLAFDPHVEIAPDDGVRQVSELGELLAGSDLVSVHARASAVNEELFGATEFASMRSGSFFVNTARETLVDEAALEQALRVRHLAGAALDVVRPRTGPHPLLAFDNVILTPHVGGATVETRARGVSMLADEIERLSRGAPLLNVINGLATAA
jgi:D-3-phosphoglycerate dehydrogenase